MTLRILILRSQTSTALMPPPYLRWRLVVAVDVVPAGRADSADQAAVAIGALADVVVAAVVVVDGVPVAPAAHRKAAAETARST